MLNNDLRPTKNNEWENFGKRVNSGHFIYLTIELKLKQGWGHELKDKH